MWDAVTVVIPGARTPDQARPNCAAADVPLLDAATMTAAREVYDEHIRPRIHAGW
ncbi:MAG: hypothetical protein EXQ49_04615 [Acidobacteria bacterium]|nr:hypothetical protein [Acidobacteriota bacterium]